MVFFSFLGFLAHPYKISIWRHITDIIQILDFFFIFSLQEAFNKMDMDGDGRLSRKEVEKAMGNVLGEADLNNLLQDLDTDQNGEVEWHEFLEVMKTRMREPESVKMLKEAFR